LTFYLIITIYSDDFTFPGVNTQQSNKGKKMFGVSVPNLKDGKVAEKPGNLIGLLI
jgi:hypothetical protein